MTGDVTRLLERWGAGDREASAELIALVYQELHAMARSQMRRERPGHTLQCTALVHEAYLRLLKDRPDRWQNRAHFCAIAAHSMRQILIDRARARGALKRGGELPRVTLDEALVAAVSGRSISSRSTMRSSVWRRSIPSRPGSSNSVSSVA